MYLQLVTNVGLAGALVISGFISRYKLIIDISDITCFIYIYVYIPPNFPFMINKTKLLWRLQTLTKYKQAIRPKAWKADDCLKVNFREQPPKW